MQERCAGVKTSKRLGKGPNCYGQMTGLEQLWVLFRPLKTAVQTMNQRQGVGRSRLMDALGQPGLSSLVPINRGAAVAQATHKMQVMGLVCPKKQCIAPCCVWTNMSQQAVYRPLLWVMGPCRHRQVWVPIPTLVHSGHASIRNGPRSNARSSLGPGSPISPFTECGQLGTRVKAAIRSFSSKTSKLTT